MKTTQFKRFAAMAAVAMALLASNSGAFNDQFEDPDPEENGMLGQADWTVGWTFARYQGVSEDCRGWFEYQDAQGWHTTGFEQYETTYFYKETYWSDTYIGGVSHVEKIEPIGVADAYVYD